MRKTMRTLGNYIGHYGPINEQLPRKGLALFAEFGVSSKVRNSFDPRDFQCYDKATGIGLQFPHWDETVRTLKTSERRASHVAPAAN